MQIATTTLLPEIYCKRGCTHESAHLEPVAAALPLSPARGVYAAALAYVTRNGPTFPILTPPPPPQPSDPPTHFQHMFSCCRTKSTLDRASAPYALPMFSIEHT